MYYNYYANNVYNRYKVLNEGVADYTGNRSAILSVGTVPMYIEKLDVVMDVELKPIVQCVDIALGEIISRYTFMAEYIRYNRTMYVLADPSSRNCFHKTMAVDDVGNLWLNVHFIYKSLNNDTNRVFGILFHELMHNFLNHLDRAKKILPTENREKLLKIDPKMLQMEDLKQNLCMDLEVNLNMVADGVVSKDFWHELHGMYDEKYMGKMWEEIYKTDGDKLLSDYMSSSSKMDEKYYEALKEIVKALKTLHDPDATDEDKSKAAAELEDVIDKLMGEKKTRKMTIRRRLKKLQKTRIKEIGEIGPYLKDIIDDLAIEPKSMNEIALDKFGKDVEILKDEMLKHVSDIASTFMCDEYDLEKDIVECMDALKNGVISMNNPSLTTEEYDDIEEEVIYAIDKLLADDIKKKELADARKEAKKKKEEERAEKMKKEIEKKKKKHILAKYFSTIKSLKIIRDHERASDDTATACQNIMDMVEPLLSKDVTEITKYDIDGYKMLFKTLKDSLYSDLMVLKESKILFHRDEAYIKRITDEFFQYNVELFKNLTTGLSKTELVSLIQSAIDSIRLIGKNLHTRAKYRATDEYKEAYKEEYKRLRKIYMELGEKGLRKELGLPYEE